jgi:hypothetical protein
VVLRQGHSRRMASSLLPVRRFVLLLALAAVALAVNGCQSGGAAGEGPGIRGYANGELNGNVVAPFDAAVAAVMQELVQMGVLNADERRDSGSVEINARTLQEVPLQIQVSRLSDDLTKLRIRAGEGDEALARSIYGKVRGRLQLQFN